MSALNRQSLPINETVVAVVLLVASFLTWGVFSPAILHGTSAYMGGSGGMHGYLTASAWNSNITLLHLTIPNWLTVIAGVGIAGCAWLDALADWQPARWVGLSLAGYGLTQIGIEMAMLLHSSRHPNPGYRTSIGLGSIIAFVSIAVLGWMIWRRVRKAQRLPSQAWTTPRGAGLGGCDGVWACCSSG